MKDRSQFQDSGIESAPRMAFSIVEFCRLVGISTQLFFKIPPKDRPVTFCVGRRRLVSHEAAGAWIRQREAASQSAAAAAA